jgi:dienelactone hydrolase
MRNVFPLVGLGCFSIIVIGAIVGGIIMIGQGVGNIDDLFKKDPQPKQAPTGGTNLPKEGQPLPKETRTLQEARALFTTNVVDSNYQRSGENLPEIPQTITATYNSGNLNLAALLSVEQKKGPKQPLVVWVHDGFGGVTAQDWALAKPFHDRGFAVMIPSFREENVDKVGRFEMFYGEVDDLFAAIEYGARLPGIDANRVYVVGHGTGGTLALLAAVSGRAQPAVRAYFAIGGTPYLEETLRVPGTKIANVSPPFDTKIKEEVLLRSALPFAASIRQPTFYFGASTVDVFGSNQATRMEDVANANRKQPLYRAFLIPKATRENFEQPLVELIRTKIEADRTGKATAIQFTPVEVNQPFK